MIRRLFAGFGISSLIIFVTIIGQILAIPVLLEFWGDQIYGEWIVLSSLSAALSILNLGVQTYAGNRLIACYVKGDIELGTTYLHAALRLYTVLCVLGLIVLLFLFIWPETTNWLNIREIPDFKARIIIGIQGLLAVYALAGGLLIGIFRVIKQHPRQLTYSLIERTIILFVPVIIALAGGFPLSASITICISIFVVAVYAIHDVINRSPFRIGISKSTWLDSVSLLKPSFSFFGVTLSTTLLTSGMILIITIYLGATEVAVFTTTLMITNFVRLIIQQFLNVLWPEITAAASNDAYEKMLNWYYLSIKILWSFVLVISLLIAVFGPDILTFWTRDKLEINSWLNFCLVIYLFVQIPALISNTFGLATNRQGAILKIQIFSVLLSLTSAAVLLEIVGVLGAALGLLSGQIIGTIFLIGQTSIWLKTELMPLLYEIIIKGIPTIFMVIFGGTFIWISEQESLIQLIGFVIVASLSLMISWKTWFVEQQRSQCLDAIHSIIPMNKSRRIY